MTENNMEGGQPEGTVREPTQQVSAGTGVEQLSSVDLKAIGAALKELQGQVRALQGEKDRGVHELKQQVGDLTKQFKRYEQLKARGMEPEEIERQFELDALLAERRTGTESTATPTGSAGTTTQAASDPIAALLPNLGLDPNSSEVVAAIRAHPNEPMAQLAAFNDLAAKKKAAQAQPANAAQIMSSAGGATAAGDDIDSLTAKLIELQKEPSKNMKQIREVQAKLQPLLPTK